MPYQFNPFINELDYYEGNPFDQDLNTTDQPQFLTFRTDEVTNHTVFVGDDAGVNSTGAYSTFVGEHAGEGDEGTRSTGLGYRALYYNSGDYCTGFGYQALRSNTGNYSTGIGVDALRSNTAGNCNAFGYQALYYNKGTYSNAFGYYGLVYNTGDYSNGFGYLTLQCNTGDNCNAIGYKALDYNNGDYNTAFGDQAFNTWTDNVGSAKTFAPEDCTPATNQVTITGHGFGTGYINLKVSTDDTLPAGLDAGIDQWKIIDVNTLECVTDTFADGGSGTHTLTPPVIYTNSMALGYNAEPDASYQIMLGDANITEVKTIGKYIGSGAHLDQSIDDAAIPVLTLDQADISEGFINFIGSDRGVITEATNSLESVRVEINGTVRRIAMYADA